MPQRVNINSPNLHPKYRNKSQDENCAKWGSMVIILKHIIIIINKDFNNNYPPKRNRGGPVMRFGLKF